MGSNLDRPMAEAGKFLLGKLCLRENLSNFDKERVIETASKSTLYDSKFVFAKFITLELFCYEKVLWKLDEICLK